MIAVKLHSPKQKAVFMTQLVMSMKSYLLDRRSFMKEKLENKIWVVSSLLQKVKWKVCSIKVP